MGRKRGGTTGQGGSKRTASSPPVGATYKDSRRNIQGDEYFDEDEQWTHVTRNRPKSPGKQPETDTRNENSQFEKMSIVEKLNKQSSEKGSVIERPGEKKKGSIIDQLNARASIRGSQAGSVHGDGAKTRSEANRQKVRESLYKTAPADGCMRDVITVEINTKDGEAYRGTVTYTEARYEMFGKGMDLPDDILHGIKIQFGSGPTVTYKLSEQIDVDELSSVEHFEFERTVNEYGKPRKEIFGCKIKGIHQRRPYANDNQQEDEPAPNVFNVKIIGCDYSVEEEEMLEWLKMYGETFGKPNENFYYDPRPDVKPVGDGTYTVKMRIDKQIPQFLPMYGKKVKIEHRSIQILCTNCYGKHPRKVCQSPKTPWMDYVAKFMRENQDISNKMIGRWYEIAMQEGRVNSNNEKTHETRPMSDDIVRGSDDMQDAIKKVKEISRPRNSSNVRQENGPKKHLGRTDPETLKQIISIRSETENGERLYELTELGLSVEAAKDLVEREKELESVHKMLDEKRKKEKLKGSGTRNERSNPRDEVNRRPNEQKW
jgi:hypothetical protein